MFLAKCILLQIYFLDGVRRQRGRLEESDHQLQRGRDHRADLRRVGRRRLPHLRRHLLLQTSMQARSAERK